MYPWGHPVDREQRAPKIWVRGEQLRYSGGGLRRGSASAPRADLIERLLFLLLVYKAKILLPHGFGFFVGGGLGCDFTGSGLLLAGGPWGRFGGGGGNEEVVALKIRIRPDERHVGSRLLQIGESEHSFITWVIVIVLGIPSPQLDGTTP